MGYLRWTRARAVSAYVAVCALSAIATQLVMERFDETGFTLTLRHAALFACVAIGIAVLIAVALCHREASGLRDLKRRIRLDLNELPFRAGGWRFLMLTFALSLGLAILAQHGEGRSLAGHDDVAAWVTNSLIIALLAAILSYLALRVVPAASIAVLRFFIGEPSASRRVFGVAAFSVLAQRHETWPAPLFQRPPPLQA